MSEEKKYHCEKARKEIEEMFKSASQIPYGIPVDDKAVVTAMMSEPDYCIYCGKFIEKENE